MAHLDAHIAAFAQSSGGVHQRLQVACADSISHAVDFCVTAQLLIELWVSGCLPAHYIQKICSALIEDGVTSVAIHCLSKLGHYGAYPGNVPRDLKRVLKYDSMDVPEPFIVSLPLMNHSISPPRLEFHDTPILLASDVLHWLYSSHPDEIRRRLGADEAILEHYWEGAAADDPKLISHPLKDVPNYKRHCLPGRFHGDGVPYST